MRAPELPDMPPSPYTSTEVAALLGVAGNVAWRWLRTIGHERQAWHWPTADISEREVVAIYAAFPYGRHDLGSLLARTIARTSYVWVYASLHATLGATTPEELLHLWRKVGTPPGVVVDTEHLASEVAERLGRNGPTVSHNVTGVPQ